MAGYIGTQPVPQATQTRDRIVATAGQTSFVTGGYTPQFLDVYLNGVFLSNGTDYTASNGFDVVLTTGATVDDVLEVVAYTTFEVANTGIVRQTVQAKYFSAISTSNNSSMVDTGFNCQITPTSSTSKVLALVTLSKVRKTGDTVTNVRLYRNTTSVTEDIGNLDTGDTQLLTIPYAFQYLDSPATTSQITYRIYWRGANANMYGPQHITLMEIAG